MGCTPSSCGVLVMALVPEENREMLRIARSGDEHTHVLTGQLVQHPVVRGIEPLQMLLWTARLLK